ncbi:MAG: hypothetical protein L3K15_03735 [Thermoplasmata archaeon]|nr:hypothetical protein [Thermoplasmata archaeon]
MMVYDPNQGAALVFGGYDFGLFSSETWKYTASGWTQLNPVTSPAARGFGAMIFDVRDNYTLLFGGYNGSVLGDTWKFSGGTWSKLTPTSSPAPRSDASVTYDPVAREVILFGGFGSAQATRNDTWAFAAGSWTNVTPAHAPSPRSGAAMTYDGLDGYAILFGGYESGLIYANDTWSFSGGTWSQLTVTSSPPPGEWDAMAYDVNASVVELYGGLDQFGGAGTWTFAAGVWRQYFPIPAPAAAQLATMAYDPALGGVVVTGGAGGYGYSSFVLLNDTWLVNGTTWILLVGPPAPKVLDGSAMTYDAADGADLLFGGFLHCQFCATVGDYVGDTWTLSAGAWTHQRPVGDPTARAGASLAYDPSLGETVLFGGATLSVSGLLNDTWVYRSGNWTQLATSVAPSSRYGATLVYDPSGADLVLFGGSDNSGTFQDTWLFRNGSWIMVTPSSGPSARAWAAAATDWLGGRVVMFGGCGTAGAESYGCSGTSTLNDTWEFENRTWKTVRSANAPTGRFGAATAGAAIVPFLPLYGGEPSIGRDVETWLFSNGSWSVLNLTPNPGVRALTSMAYDPSAQTFWLTGGTGGGESDLWGLVVPDLLIVLPLVANRSAVDLGESVSLDVSATGETGSPTITWSGLPGCPGQNSSHLVCTVSSSGTFVVSVHIVTTTGQSATSPGLQISVNPDPTVSAISATPNHLFIGQSLALNVSVRGGTGTFGYTWFGLPPGCSSADASSILCTPSAASDGGVSIVVVDEAGYEAASAPTTVEVWAPPLLATPTPTRASADVGQSVTFSSAVTGVPGFGRLSWIGLPAGCSSANVTIITCRPSNPGDGSVHVQLDYAARLNVTSASLPFVAFRDPTISAPHASPASPVAGQNLTLSVLTTSGSGQPFIVWGGISSLCVSRFTINQPSFTCTVRPGTYSIWANVTDSNGFVATSAPLNLSVALAPSGGPAPVGSAPSASLAELLAVTAAIAGAGGIVAIAILRRRRGGAPGPRAGEEPRGETLGEGPGADEELSRC